MWPKPQRHGMNRIQGKPKDRGLRTTRGGGGGGGGHLCTFQRHRDESKTNNFNSKVGGAGNEKSA